MPNRADLQAIIREAVLKVASRPAERRGPYVFDEDELQKLAAQHDLGGRVEAPSTTSDRTTDPSPADVVARLRVTADFASPSADSSTYLNEPCRELLKQAADLITILQARAEKAERERDEARATLANKEPTND